MSRPACDCGIDYVYGSAPWGVQHTKGCASLAEPNPLEKLVEALETSSHPTHGGLTYSAFCRTCNANRPEAPVEGEPPPLEETP